MITEEQVRRVLTMADLIPLMEWALADFSAGRVNQPVRTVMPVRDGFLGMMPAAAEALGVKLVTVYPNNRDVDTHHAVIALFRPDTGEPLCVMDGRLITEMRTAAVSAVATAHLSRPDARVLAVLGAGVQARAHLAALALVRTFDTARIWSRTYERAAALGPAVRTAEEAVRGADVVCTVTASAEPVLRGEWLKPGAHVNAVGACRPTHRELDEAAVRRARLFVDSREAARVEAGDILLNRGEIAGEIGEVVGGAVVGRQSDAQITVFKSLGLAIEDVAAAHWVYSKVGPC